MRVCQIGIQVALILFSSLTETIGDLLRPHFATLQSVFVNGLNDQQSNRVRVAALKYALCTYHLHFFGICEAAAQ